MPPTRLRALLLLPAVLLLILAGPAHAVVPSATRGVTNPTGVQPQLSAAPAIVGPAGARTCTQQLLVHDFQNSYYKPGLATYTPHCKGPWSKVVLSLTGSVKGDQFDRTLAFFLGGTLLLRGTTSEPCCTPGTDDAVTWTVQHDVSNLTTLFTKKQPVAMELDNVNDSTYTGIYHVVVSVTFSSPTATGKAISAPQWITSVNPTTPGAMYQVSKVGQRVGATIHPPRSLTHLTAELFADGHGPCEEFWWSEPNQCGIGTPFREVAVYLDGRLAGAAPIYPTVYTGANGPGLWEPIPSPRAWDVRPYDVDLTPFVGTLVDGKAHTVQVGMIGAAYTNGDYWPISATLIGREGTGISTGSLTHYAPGASTSTVDSTGTRFTQQHALSFIGTLRNAGLTTTTTVTDAIGGTSTLGEGVTANDTYTWEQKVMGVTKAHRTQTDMKATYGLADLPVTHFAFTDSGSETRSIDGKPLPTSSYDVTMSTEAVGLAYNGVEREEWTVTYGPACYRRQLTAAAGQIVGDLTGCNTPMLPDPQT